MNTKLPPLPPVDSEQLKLVWRNLLRFQGDEAEAVLIEAMQSYALAYGELVRAECLPAGWIAVPKEPTDEMLCAGFGYWLNIKESQKQRATARREWQAMISAAPTPPLGNPVQAPKKYVHEIPEHCDRITWRGRYFLLENLVAAPPAQEPQPVLQTEGYKGVEPAAPMQLDAGAKKMAELFDYPWEHMPYEGRQRMRDNVIAVLQAIGSAHPQPPSAPDGALKLAQEVVNRRANFGWSTEVDDAIRALEVALQGAPADAQPPTQQASEQHPDDTAVDTFAAAMKQKLAFARTKGRGGWQRCSREELSRMLREHVDKGDARDVANFCMFLWSLSHSIAPAPKQFSPDLGGYLGASMLTGRKGRRVSLQFSTPEQAQQFFDSLATPQQADAQPSQRSTP